MLGAGDVSPGDLLDTHKSFPFLSFLTLRSATSSPRQSSIALNDEFFSARDLAKQSILIIYSL
jgi:hypothetical protein